MLEVADNSVDLIVVAPPYNIDTPYDDAEGYDHKPFEEFKTMLDSVVKECSRVLKPGGILLNEAADTIYSKGKLIALSGLIQRLCLDHGLSIMTRHINFLQSKDGVELLDKEHNWSKDYYSMEDSHSNCHQWLLFRKGTTDFDEKAGKIFYVNYPSSEDGHPCPFSDEHIEIFLPMLGFKKGMTVLEPFMGTAKLGKAVLERGGQYVGYELSIKQFITAKNRLER